MSYIIGTYESAIEDGAPDYCDEVDSLEQLSEVIKRAEDYGMTLTDLNIMKYDPDSGGSDYDDLGSLQELSDANQQV